MNKLIVLVGMCGSGKSVVSEYYKSKGYAYVYFGGITLEEIQKRSLELNAENEKFVREDLRKIHGMAAYAILSLPKIEAGLKTGNVLIDGLYSWSEYKILKDKFGDDLNIITVYAPPKMRYERLAKRQIRPLTFEESKKRDYAEIENIEKGGPIAMSEYTLINDKDVEHLMKQVEALPF
jgi:dephospho-CoA kinase